MKQVAMCRHSPAQPRRRMAVLAALVGASLSACTIGDVTTLEPSAPASSPQPTLPDSGAEVSDGPAAGPALDKEPTVIKATDLQEAVDAIAADNPGTGIAVAGSGTVAAAGITDPLPAWSTVKVPLAIAAERAGVAEADVVSRAITYSDNAAADSLWEALGGGEQAAQATQAIIGTSTVPATPPRPGFSAFGQTQWSVSQQAEFIAALGCQEGADPILVAMGQPDPAQHYGLRTLEGAVMKGGWGPAEDGSYEARQMGLITLGEHTVAVAIYAAAPSGDYGEAQQMLSRVVTQLATAEVEWPDAGCQQGAV
ncbi:hypothetical protein [Corynebacterium aurimucosum]|uniref:hypothetical protein n=2 Tax=Corynebacterium aurimucosum TaxID=169292 RepID=UPI00209FD797|nr:hypothetical protein [Corynebacterium aurimucosum]WJY69992.1 hypothetical protein CAURIM_04310 [Corynebacterium aurimucosum]